MKNIAWNVESGADSKNIDPQALTVIQMQSEHIEFVYNLKFCDHNKAALYGGNLALDEWKQVFRKSLADPDKADFIIRKGSVPVAWLELNGFQGDMAWISMLVVHEDFQHQGIGSSAVCFAEDYVCLKGFTSLRIRMNSDNIAAQKCFRKLGYTIVDECDCTNGDGIKRRGLTLYRDHLDAVRMSIDGVFFHLGEQHDFSFIHKIGRVFRVFDAMDSGNICFGVKRDGRRYFIKYAGVRTMDYKGEVQGAVNRLKDAVFVYEDLQHPFLIRLIKHYPVGDGYVAIFDWVDGEGMLAYWDYAGPAMRNCTASPNYRFKHLPVEKRIAVVDKIIQFHQYVLEHGYIPVDFYDGSMIYDFDTSDFHICDIDFYRKAPAKNDMGRMWGSTRFMSPEEYELGADLDEKTVVYIMGAAAFELLGEGIKGGYQGWSATKALYDVAAKAVSPEPGERYQKITELIESWNTAKL
jgi:serine/threonine protein kinase, bacterial